MIDCLPDVGSNTDDMFFVKPHANSTIHSKEIIWLGCCYILYSCSKINMSVHLDHLDLMASIHLDISIDSGVSSILTRLHH